MPNSRHLRPLVPVLLALLALGGCAGGSGAATPSPSATTIDSAAAAAARVAEDVPLFGSVDAKDPELIGQAHWWTATPVAGDGAGWRVAYRVGWGDCPAGCIDAHTWTYDVTRAGEVSFVSEDGPAVPEDVLAELWSRGASGGTGIAGRATAGPTCPVAQPDDPACADRPVAGATIVVSGPDGGPVASAVTDGAGFFHATVPAGSYTVTPPPVEGLMGTPEAQDVTVAAGSQAIVRITYDTGIR